MSECRHSVARRVEMWKVTRFFVIFWGYQSGWSQVYPCHDDPSYSPVEGPLEDLQFTWLGTLQYINLKNGHPHYFRVPRVVLISPQFVLCTAKDAAQVPEGYALGNVAFGEYERDELECGLTMESLSAGAACDSAAVLVPLWDVMLHPEYKHSGELESIALLKLLTAIKSEYMVPVCLPLKSYLINRRRKSIDEQVFHVDFSSGVPRDIMDEEKEMIRISLLPKEACFINDDKKNTTYPTMNKIVCTSGCDFYSGAPSIVHENSGHWSIVALAQGGPLCPDPLRSDRPPSPARHILIRPYVPWIMTSITGEILPRSLDMNDPFGFIIPRVYPEYIFGTKRWNGHWWIGGIPCFNRGPAAEKMSKFYQEVFQVKPSNDTTLTYILELVAPGDKKVTCVKIGMPYRLMSPSVSGLNTPEIKLLIPVLKLTGLYRFEVEAWTGGLEAEVNSSEKFKPEFDSGAFTDSGADSDSDSEVSQ